MLQTLDVLNPPTSNMCVPRICVCVRVGAKFLFSIEMNIYLLRSLWFYPPYVCNSFIVTLLFRTFSVCIFSFRFIWLRCAIHLSFWRCCCCCWCCYWINANKTKLEYVHNVTLNETLSHKWAAICTI